MFALGALVGVAAAMLLAPDKGTQTRKRIATHVKSSDVVNKGRELYERGREIAQEASDMFEHGRLMAEAGFDEQLETERSFERGF